MSEEDEERARRESEAYKRFWRSLLGIKEDDQKPGDPS